VKEPSRPKQSHVEGCKETCEGQIPSVYHIPDIEVQFTIETDADLRRKSLSGNLERYVKLSRWSLTFHSSIKDSNSSEEATGNPDWTYPRKILFWHSLYTVVLWPLYEGHRYERLHAWDMRLITAIDPAPYLLGWPSRSWRCSITTGGPAQL